ncbi:MAG TPA: TetR/AcrR family transcriptional regulator [Terriglobales bacterium]
MRTAVAMASVKGLEGISIGDLADELEMSKSGLFAHFGSKEELQLATIEAARQIFIDEVAAPALKAPKGLPRLWGLYAGWLSYAERRVFPGGCFFTGVAFEFDSRTGPVRDRIAALMQEWLDALTRAVHEAQKAGHLQTNIDAKQLGFEIHALGMGAIWASQLLDDKKAFAKVLRILCERLQQVQTKTAPRLSAKH